MRSSELWTDEKVEIYKKNHLRPSNLLDKSFVNSVKREVQVVHLNVKQEFSDQVVANSYLLF